MKHLPVLLLLVIAFASCKKDPRASSTVMPYELGNAEILVFSEGESEISENLFKCANGDIVSQLIQGTGLNSTNAFLLLDGERKYMFDTGVGGDVSMMEFNFKKAGINPEEITKIFLTHMHGDHTGGMLDDGEVVFPNATVYVSKPEYDYWTNEDTMNTFPSHQRGMFLSAMKVAKAYDGKFSFFSPGEIGGEATLLEPGITAFLTPGHTPGHTSYIVESDSQKLMIWGDITHLNEVQIPYPEITIIYDTDQSLAFETRNKVLEYVYENKLPVAGMHLSFPAIGNVSKGKDGRYEFSYVKIPYKYRSEKAE